MSKKTQPSPYHDESKLVIYPTSYVFCIIDTEADKDKIVEGLKTMGYIDEAFVVGTGTASAEAMDVDGSHHGLRGRIVRALQNIGEEHEAIENYANAMKEDKFVVGAPTDDIANRDEVVKLYKAHAAYYVNYCGTGSITTL